MLVRSSATGDESNGTENETPIYAPKIDWIAAANKVYHPTSEVHSAGAEDHKPA